MSFGEETQNIRNINTVEVLTLTPNDLYISVHSKRGCVTHSSRSISRPGISCGLRTAGSDEHNYCSHSSTAEMGVKYIRTVLPADAYGRQRRPLCMFCCLPVVYVLGCVLVREGKKNRQNVTSTNVQNKASCREPGKSSYPLPKIKTLSTRQASYSARIELNPQRQVPDGFPMST